MCFEVSVGKILTNLKDIEVTVVLSYDPEKLYDINPKQLRIALYNTTTKNWEILQNNTVLNIQNHTVANTTTTLTYFAVVYPIGNTNSVTKVLSASVTNQNIKKQKNTNNQARKNTVETQNNTAKNPCFLFICW